MGVVSAILVVLLSVFGAVEVIRKIVFWTLKTENASEFSVVVVPESAEDCEYLVRSAAEKMRWLDFDEPVRLVCVNDKEDPEIDAICQTLSVKYPYLFVSKSFEIAYNDRDRVEDT